MYLGSEAGRTTQVVSQTTKILLPGLVIVCPCFVPPRNPSSGVRVPITQGEGDEPSLSSPVNLEKVVLVCVSLVMEVCVLENETLLT